MDSTLKPITTPQNYLFCLVAKDLGFCTHTVEQGREGTLHITGFSLPLFMHSPKCLRHQQLSAQQDLRDGALRASTRI